MTGTAWNAGFSRYGPPQAGGETDLVRRKGAAARQCTGGSDEAAAALWAAVPAEAGVPSGTCCRTRPGGSGTGRISGV